MTKQILYYTDSRLEEPINTIAQRQLLSIGLPIISVSLQPMNFGTNIVMNLTPGVSSMLRQIVRGLQESTADAVFFCEHDVLYHPSHFDIEPSKDLFHYNTNAWRWDYPNDRLITYDRVLLLSSLCVNRLLALNSFIRRIGKVDEKGWADTSREPYWARKMGYEPGTKSDRQKTFKDEICETWESTLPNIDIRHKGTITKRKTHLTDFKHLPTNWRESPMDEIEGWGLRKLFNL